MADKLFEVKPNATLLASDYFAQAGISTVPIRLDGSKSPACSWAEFQQRLPTPAERLKFYDRPDPYGIATIQGRVSGNLELLDFDTYADEIFPAWCELVTAEMPDLIARLNIVQTPREPPGRHVRYRCAEVAIPSNMKLAEEVYADPETGKPKRRTMIETRGEGGYAIAPGSPPEVHENKRPYLHIGGPVLSRVQTITAAEREVLLRCAAGFSRTAEPEAAPASKRATLNGAVRVGDDYNAHGPGWQAILEPHGWTCVRASGSKCYWKRPGKGGAGWSATTGVCTNGAGHEYLSVFSSNAEPFPGPSGGRICSVHTKFAAYTVLNHGGDFKAAARQLAAEGFGEQKQRASKNTNGEAPAANGRKSSKFTLGPLALEPGQPRQTQSGKITLPVNVLRDGVIVFPFVLTNAASGRKEPIRVLRQLLGDDHAHDDIDKVLTQILAHAAGRLQTKEMPSGPTVRQIIGDKMREALQLVCRSERGLWSEYLGEEIRRCDLVAFTPDWLINECGKASDAPKDVSGEAVRPDLIRLVQVELGVLWADLLSTLPPAADVDLGKDTARGRAFRQAVIRLWKTPGTWERQQTPGGDTASKASLASRVISQKIRGVAEHPGRDRWQAVHPACDAWWRNWLTPEGELVTLLAMRWTLGSQVGIEMPGVKDEETLTRLGMQFGVLQKPPPGVPSRLSGGKHRLAVLSLDVAQELLEMPSEDPEENPREPGA
jgi:putative DNA primase/helicase